MSLNEKVAIVTGSGAGLGRSFAQELASQGASVIVNDVNEAAAAETVEAIQAAGGRAEAVVAPVGPTSSADLLVNSAVEKFGRLDILVTNAGILRDRSLLKMTDEDFDAVRAFRFWLFQRKWNCRSHHHNWFADWPARKLWSEQLRGSQGRHRRYGAHLGT